MMSAPKTISGRRARISSQKRMASHQPGLRTDGVDQRGVGLDGIDRTDAQARQVGDQPQDALHQVAQRRAARQIGAP
jgi:hypothetical protein